MIMKVTQAREHMLLQGNTATFITMTTSPINAMCLLIILLIEEVVIVKVMVLIKQCCATIVTCYGYSGSRTSPDVPSSHPDPPQT